ncbi:MAG TPA: ATP-binding cassette domain-containing protein [Vicinamibacteria bacterium]|nr:ATP-binding cassette domain-containing protein [Vicinamibacteria bacterium]
MSEIFRKIQEATQDVSERVQDVADRVQGVTDKVTGSVAELLGVPPLQAAPAAQRSIDEPVVSFRDVHLAFDRPILRGVSFDLHPGATKVVLGGSGSGKTTILRLILGLLKPDAGSILVDGAEVATMTEEELRHVRLKIGMVFQEGALFDSLTVAENVGYRLLEDGVSDEAVEGRVAQMLGFVDLGAHAVKSPAELSGGQRRRVAVARALAARPEIMLYDEPTTGLDPITATTITDLIVKVRDLDGVTSILVTHQLRDAFNVARTFVRRAGSEFGYARVEDLRIIAGTDFLMLREGRVCFEGSPHELLSSRDPYIRDFLS